MPGGEEFLIRNIVTPHTCLGTAVGILEIHHAELQSFHITSSPRACSLCAFLMRIFVPAPRTMTTFATHPFFNILRFLAGDNSAMTLHAIGCSLVHVCSPDAREIRNLLIRFRIRIEGIDGHLVRIVFPPVVFRCMTVILSDATTTGSDGLIRLGLDCRMTHARKGNYDSPGL